MKCKICQKKVMPTYARGRFREYQIGYYCPKCQRFVQKPGGNVKVETPVELKVI